MITSWPRTAPATAAALAATTLAATTFAACLAGCSGAAARPTGGPQTAADVLAAVDARPQPETVQGEARMEAYVDGKARKADLLLRIARPTGAHLQALTPTGDMIAVLATDGTRFVSFERGGRVCHTGAACARNMARLLPLPMPPAELVAALLGRPPRIAAAQQSLTWDGDRGAWRVQLLAPPLRQELWVRPPQMDVLASVLYRDGKRVASIAYADHGKAGIAGLPSRMRVQLQSQGGVDLSVTLGEVSANEAIEPEAFAPPCPSGMASEELPCDDADATPPPPAAPGVP